MPFAPSPFVCVFQSNTQTKRNTKKTSNISRSFFVGRALPALDLRDLVHHLEHREGDFVVVLGMNYDKFRRGDALIHILSPNSVLWNLRLCWLFNDVLHIFPPKKRNEFCFSECYSEFCEEFFYSSLASKYHFYISNIFILSSNVSRRRITRAFSPSTNTSAGKFRN